MMDQLDRSNRIQPSAIPLLARINACESCNSRCSGLCAEMPSDETRRIALLRTTQRVEGGETFLEEGQPADHFFTIVSGWVKIYKLLADGRRQITGFLSQGDVLGLAFNGEYAYSAEALTEVALCRFPRAQFERLLDEFPRLERRLLTIASNELAAAQDQMILLGRKTAQERIASFLLDLASRDNSGVLQEEFLSLEMTRRDIADYLGLTTETVSRVFTALRHRGCIALEGANRVQLLDIEALEELAAGTDCG